MPRLMGKLWEGLESRTLRSAAPIWSPSVTETRPDESISRAIDLPPAYDGITRINGSISSKADVDYYRFHAWHDGSVRASVASLEKDESASLRIYNPDGDAVTGSTTDATSFAVSAGKTYYVRVTRQRGTPRYRVLLKQSGLNVPASRVTTLNRGVNISSWFWNQFGSDDPYEVFGTFFTADDARKLKASGFRNVRLPIDTQYFVDWRDPAKLNTRALKALDKAIKLLNDNGLAVVISPFGDYNDRVVWDGWEKKIITFIHSWADHFTKFSPEKVFLQVANEPAGDPSVWLPAQQRIVEEMRKRAPNFTILTSTTLRFAGGDADFGTIDALLASKPLQDPNVVYGFHYYAPYIFTAQGAEWAWSGYGALQYVPYPSSPNAVQWLVDKLDAELTDETQRAVIDALKLYGQNHWNGDSVLHEFERVQAWSKKYSVHIMADEFGAIADTQINSADRNRWLHDVRSAAEKLGFAWAMWDYAAGYNLADGDWGNRTIRTDVLEALGLKS